jgi:hypothetical protein
MERIMRKYRKFFVLYALFLGYHALGHYDYVKGVADTAGFVLVAETMERVGAAEILRNIHVVLGTIYT